MSLDFVPEGATCALHTQTPATWVCGRCGSFVCTDCERRTRPDARPMCPGCWDLRARVVPKNDTRSGTRLQTAGLVLGIISLIPFLLAVQVGSLVLNIVAIVRAKEPPARDVRWRPITGLILTLLGLFGTALVVLLA